MSKFKVGDEVRVIPWPGNDRSYSIPEDQWKKCEGITGKIEVVFPSPQNGEVYLVRFPHDYWNFGESALVPASHKSTALTKEQRAIAKKEAELAALKEAAAKKAQQSADRKAKQERAKILRNLSPAGKRVVAMLQAGSAQDFGCQRENVIALVAAITGDRADDIKKALQ